MNIGIIGLGRMGIGIATRLRKAGHAVLGYDRSDDSVQYALRENIKVATSLQEVTRECEIVWLMVPAGKPVDIVIEEISAAKGVVRIIIDGGNSFYKDSIRRAAMLDKQAITFLDCGTSGGVAGKDAGYCLMIGGDQKIIEECALLWQAVAAPHGFSYVGPSGAGHYVKMIHNGIEYGMLQAYAEGFQLLREGKYQLDLAEISRVWDHGSVIRSHLLTLFHEVLRKDQTLDTISGNLEESGTGRWTVQEAQEQQVEVPVIAKSLEVRGWSRATGGNFATKLIALVRNAFGGHAFKKLK